MGAHADAGAERRFQVDRISGALCLAQSHLEQLRRTLEPGLSLSVVAMLESDIDSAHQRVAWIRERLARESEPKAS